MKILVTGGAGYIGSVVVSELVQAGDKVIVIDNLSQGHQVAVHSDAIFLTGDLADRPFLDKLMAKYKPEEIMHFASNTLVSEFVSDLQNILETAWTWYHKHPHGYEDKR